MSTFVLQVEPDFLTVLNSMAKFAAWNVERAHATSAELWHRAGAALRILHALQQVFGGVPEAAVPMVARVLNPLGADLHGVKAAE